MKKALIFDMDGVIIDSEKHWQTSELSLMKKWIPSWSHEDQLKIIGLNLNDIYKVLVSDYGFLIDKVIFKKEVEEVAIGIYKNYAQLMPGFLDVLKGSYGKLSIGLASSAKRDWIDITLDKFNLRSYFDYTLSADQITGPGKPAPDIYLSVAENLGVSPNRCIVIEDSTHGISAAKSAGMFCIGFRSSLNQSADLSAADEIIEGFGKWGELGLLG